MLVQDGFLYLIVTRHKLTVYFPIFRLSLSTYFPHHPPPPIPPVQRPTSGPEGSLYFLHTYISNGKISPAAPATASNSAATQRLQQQQKTTKNHEVSSAGVEKATEIVTKASTQKRSCGYLQYMQHHPCLQQRQLY
jgi:hypothetical protein